MTGVLLKDAIWFISQLDPGDPRNASDEDVAAVAPLLSLQRMPRGEVLFRPRVVPRGVWAVRRGVVELAVGAGSNRRIVDVAKRGELVGMPYALLSRRADVTARTVTCVEAIFCRGDIRGLLDASPHLARLCLEKTSWQLLETRERIIELLGGTLAQRLARLLITESDEQRLPMSQSQIAQMLGAQRSSVNRALRSFEDQGVLRLRYASVEIVEPERLKAIAHSRGATAEAASRPTDPAPSPRLS